MKVFKKAAIVGVGLIGGSIGLILKKKKIAADIVGVCRHEASIARAVERGALDAGATSLDIVRGADLVVFAAPVSAIIELAPRVAALVGSGCIVTDVGSSKARIVSALESIFPLFVGSHPLAGSEKKGVDAADAGLFKGSVCIMTPTRGTNPEARRRVAGLWQALGCSLMTMSPGRHDAALAAVSHIPHAVAFALIDSIPAEQLPLAAAGLRDTTRIAASDETLWSDILLSNRDEVLRAAGRFETEFRRFIAAIRRNDQAGLKKLIARARSRRNNLR